jgi:hypothetical protein
MQARSARKAIDLPWQSASNVIEVTGLALSRKQPIDTALIDYPGTDDHQRDKFVFANVM